MLVVLSDLHLSDKKSTQIGTRRFFRNLPPETYRSYFRELNQIILANNLAHLDFVLAGDILEISRSSQWLKGDARPYIDNNDVQPGSEAEKTILSIIEDLAKEERVGATFNLFRNIQDYFAVEVNLHYILGNHDRLVNATPDIRQRVRELLGLEGLTGLFPTYLVFEDYLGKPFCLVRHGHEYDPTNFAINIQDYNEIPTKIPLSTYGKACLGDIITVEYGASLPWIFEQVYGQEAIRKDNTLLAMWQRLNEFDDVRPTSAWSAYLFSTPGISREKTWTLLEPCFVKIINNLRDVEHFNKTLRDSDAVNEFVRIAMMFLLKIGVFRKGIPFWLVNLLMKAVSSEKLDPQVKWAKKEELILDKNSGCQCVISGHTHFSEVSLISASEHTQRYYINSGTWRNVIPATTNLSDFGRLKGVTKVVVFYPQETYDESSPYDWAFHTMSGVSYGDRRLI
jgi:UDP-2,3-diacylglucosamine pyrophosphatase LpxH